MEVTFKCDRCKKELKGLKVLKENESFTSGFYLVEEGSNWSKYKKPFENIVCDECMWKDPLYLEDYPHMKVKEPESGKSNES
jgi:hypothetical protein